MNEGNVDPAKLTAVLNYDGAPITARFITAEISRAMRGRADATVQEAAQ
jgi:2-oxoglutarate ferredoxin oxidoreductase subunit alpha